MNEKIKDQHLARIAFVYPRQSSMRQVRVNVESRLKQEQMRGRAEVLGWPSSRVVMLGADLGKSGSTQHGREDYQRLVQAVVSGEAGMVFARELSRLVRDNQDWTQLVRLCRFKDVLLGDEHRIYDAGDPQDRVVLGIQGAFNEFELSVLTSRMLACRIQKAQRGELKINLPAGYITRHKGRIEKHPDERVQRAVERVFDVFQETGSVRQLYMRLRAEGYRLPSAVPHGDWREVQWVVPAYDRLLDMLKNPTYTGAYVWGRWKSEAQLDEQGHVVKKRKVLSEDRWQVHLEGHHAAYISKVEWKRNMEKIASNANMKGALVKGPARAGKSLVAGLLRCRRCGNKLETRYVRKAGELEYICRQGSLGRQQRGSSCFSFLGRRVEPRFVEEILYVISPAGVEAAAVAAKRLEQRHQQQRKLFVDQVSSCEEKAALAQREYRQTDPAFHEIRRALGAEWNQALVDLETQKAKLREFDETQPAKPTAKQQGKLRALGANLERVWHHPRVNNSLKKQIVRTLVEEIVVDVDGSKDEVIWNVHWAGGYHSELRVPRRVPSQRYKTRDLKAMVKGLRKVMDDRHIALTLNRQAVPCPAEKTWTKDRVRVFRSKHKIPAYNASQKETQGWLTQAEAAICLKISPMSVTRLVQAGVLPSEQPISGFPAVLTKENLYRKETQSAVNRLLKATKRPLPDHPDQLTLFDTTNS